MRYAVGFDDHSDVFDAAGHRVAGSSAMGFAYSDDSAETWHRYRIPGPSSTEIVTLIGSASLAVGEIAAREPRRPPDYPVYYAAAAVTGSSDRPQPHLCRLQRESRCELRYLDKCIGRSGGHRQFAFTGRR
jgi:hypothetical protein